MSWDALPKGTKETVEKQLANAGKMYTDQSHAWVPVNPLCIGYAATAHGRPLKDHYASPENATAWQLDVARMYDVLPNTCWNYAVYWNEDYGGTIKCPRAACPPPVS